ncbi:cytochrome c-type biogenesis protein Ccs1/ResB [Gracilibacillus boraciitolerans JCM 21714]|uniref:Cytochrome c-type biogenesis protein Ccs1/ResB n=1 Tax=Gracilibacillus boraciitolerans JCM 21714 TaxID=1298598 RepID=W4VEY0_9BACI|nr:cytochrome c biogenesis protein ResB [Gracilibacillus boraciitolerans]GAE91319.1 cytochrome c-type biogenesis protein Ccs1/ResB [Gracilibacillus boraciitolerans JCM 21714]
MNTKTCSTCGHPNKEGTTICEKCGKPLDNDHKNKLLNMRYDGSAIRSKTKNRSIVDKTWNFFSSVKIGVTLITIALVVSALGTIYPQKMYIPTTVNPAEHYRDQYGITGQIYYQLGLHELYSSWWYMILIAMIGISIFIVSIDRGVPLYRALKNQAIKRHPNFLKRQKLFSEIHDYSADDKDRFIKNLKKHRYKISEQDGHILAEKGRFSRWGGPYINHVGLIIFLLGTLFRFVPFMYVDEYLWVREGETAVIPSTNQEFYVKSEEFIFETYGEDKEDAIFEKALQNNNAPVPKHFETKAVIYRDVSEDVIGAEPKLEEVKRGGIIVNEPLKVNGLALYQDGYQLNEFKSMSFKLHMASDQQEEAIAEFTVDLTEPNSEYQFDNGYRIELGKYYPDYELNDGQPSSVSNYPRNPGFVFFVYGPDIEDREASFLAIGQNIPSGNNQYKIGLTDFSVRDVSGLTVRKDLTLPILGIGAFIFMIGVIQGMYWQHRRIWIHPGGDGKLLIACHTNKNWFGLSKEFEKVIDGTSFSMVEDQERKNDL